RLLRITMPHQGQLSPATRAAIVTLRYEGRGWTYISQMLANCSPNGVQQFFKRVLERSQCDPNNLNLPLLLQYLNDETERGGEQRFPEGSAMQEALVATSKMDREHEDMPHSQIIRIVEEHEGVRIPYETGLKVLRDSVIVKINPPRLSLTTLTNI
ncbi:hypothetical protein K469DRAFT_578872, partial [Zopfia rhizophila CBS 207.26]